MAAAASAHVVQTADEADAALLGRRHCSHAAFFTVLACGTVAPMEPIDFPLRGAHITLDALLKASGLASSGGAAKTLIAEGGVRVNGEPELRRGRKLRAGDEVTVSAQRVRIGPGSG